MVSFRDAVCEWIWYVESEWEWNAMYECYVEKQWMIAVYVC